MCLCVFYASLIILFKVGLPGQVSAPAPTEAVVAEQVVSCDYGTLY